MKKNETFGAIAVFISYVCWGFLTVFWNLLSEVDSIYILAQRIIWSMLFMGLYILVGGKGKEIREIFQDKKKLSTCLASGVLITVNWGVYIFAVNSGHVLDASLGYFIEPILVAIVGVILFKEKMSKMEKITFAFAAAGLAYIVIVSKTFPIMAILIAITFAAYGAVKKTLTITAHASLFMETLCMVPLAFIFTVFMETKGMGSIGVLQGAEFILLPACGIVTSVPLLLFNVGVKKIPYYVSGIIMYVSPTIQFIMGLVYFHEEMDVHRFIAFLLIWIGIFFTIFEKMKMIREGQRYD